MGPLVLFHGQPRINTRAALFLTEKKAREVVALSFSFEKESFLNTMNSARNTNSFDDKMNTSERSDSTDRERLLVDEEDVHWSGKKSVRSGPGRWLNIIFVVVIAIVSCLVGIFVGHNQGDSDKACTRRITQHCTS